MNEPKVHIIFSIFMLILFGCQTNRIAIDEEDKHWAIRQDLQLKIDSLEQELSRYQRFFEPGKVYSRCSVPTAFEISKSKEVYCLYTGEHTDQKGISRVQFLYRPAFTEWVKVKSSEICSPYSEKEGEHCENWHLKEIPPVYKSIYVVTDTLKIREFACSSLEVERILRPSSLTDDREFICPSVCKFDMIGKVQRSLREKGYVLDGAEENVLDEITKSAIREYQKSNGLSVGNLDFRTLKSLGIEK